MDNQRNTIVEKFKNKLVGFLAIPIVLVVIFILDLMFWRDINYRKVRKGFIIDAISFDIYLLKKKIKNKFRKHSEDEPVEEENASDDIENK